MTTKDKVLQQFPDARLFPSGSNCFVMDDTKGKVSYIYHTEEECWENFYIRHCNQPKYYKQLVLEKFPGANIFPDMNKYYVSIETSNFSDQDEAWENFYNQFCKEDKPFTPIIGEEYEFSDDNFKLTVYKGKLVSFEAEIAGHEDLFNYIRPIQTNPKEQQLFDLAKELGWKLIKE